MLFYRHILFISIIINYLAIFSVHAKDRFDLILEKQQEIKQRTDVSIPLEKSPQASGYTMNLGQGNYARSMFDEESDTIRRRSLVQAGRYRLSFLMEFDNEGKKFTQGFHTLNGAEYKKYTRAQDMFLYGHEFDEHNISGLKEWAYILKPNRQWGSSYRWKLSSDDPTRKIRLEKKENQAVAIYMESKTEEDLAKENAVQDTEAGTTISASGAKKKLRSPMSALSDAWNPLTQADTAPIAIIDAPIYWVSNGQTGKNLTVDVVGDDQMSINIHEPRSSYPLLVDPTLNYGQWIGGGGGEAAVLALGIDAASADEIYAGGWATGPYWSEGVTFQGTAESSEGFVVEIADGTTPSIVWGQWLGGTDFDLVLALAVADDEIYAGGVSLSSVSMEAIGSFVGSFDGTLTEGFVVEIADGASPSIAWGQWLGGTSWDGVNAIAVTADEIYVAGNSSSSILWETISAFSGTLSSGASEGFILELADGVAPSILWGQWLGGTGAEVLYDIEVVGDEIYVGGHSSDSINMETISAFVGTHSGATEGFVVELVDGISPSIIWGQWIGGQSTDQVMALAVTGDEIYAGGYSVSTVSMEAIAVFVGTMAATEGFVIEIADNTSPSIIWGQWLGGTGGDQVVALAVTGDEIYAGGHVISTVNMEGINNFTGTANATEGFVVELADGATPAIRWGYWAGGTGEDQVLALALTEDEIYVGGFSILSVSMEGITAFSGTAQLTEGFMIEIEDTAMVSGDYMFFGTDF